MKLQAVVSQRAMIFSISLHLIKKKILLEEKRYTWMLAAMTA